jgi:hypothetical protein
VTAAEAVEKCAEFNERLAERYEQDASGRDGVWLELARIERNQAAALRSAARLMREHVK